MSKCTQLLATIKQLIFAGISAACMTLNYKQTRPEIAFLCPHLHSSSSKLLPHFRAQGIRPPSQMTRNTGAVMSILMFLVGWTHITLSGLESVKV